LASAAIIMADPVPSAPKPDSFGEKLAGRPRARFFTIFTILGFAVTPAAVAILIATAPAPTEAETPKAVRIEALIAAVLIAAHLLCAYFAWFFWRDEGVREESANGAATGPESPPAESPGRRSR
jgi:hypothetical protein